MFDGATETLTAPPQVQEGGNSQKNSDAFAEFVAQNQALGLDKNTESTTALPEHTSPNLAAEAAMMEQIQKQIAEARQGGENVAGGAPTGENSTMMNATELMSRMNEEGKKAFLTTTEKPVEVENLPMEAGAVPLISETQKKGVWDWSPVFFKKFIEQLEESGLIPKKTDGALAKVGKVVLLPIKIPQRILSAAWNGFKNWYSPPQTA